MIAARTICSTEVSADSLPTCPEDILHGDALRSRAGEWFSTGTHLVEKSQYSKAAEAFRCSNRLVPHPATLLNLAKAVLLAGDVEEALRLYESFVAQYPGHEKRSAVINEIKTLKQQGEVSSRPVEASETVSSKLKLTTDSAGAISVPFTIRASDLQSSAAPPTSLELNGRDRRKDVMKKWGWALAGVGGAGMIVGVTFQVLASYNYLRMQDDLWWSEFTDRRQNYERYQRTATLALSISGAVLIGGMTVLLVRKGESKRQTATTVKFSVSPRQLSLGVIF
jgi:tetratricopeptide (TPR) repeat protein